MSYSNLTTIYNIDVNWALIRQAGPTSDILGNIIGGLAQDSLQAAAFAIHFLAFVAAAGLAVYSWGFAHRHATITFFGLRAALLCFLTCVTIATRHLPSASRAIADLLRSRLLLWIYLAVPNTMPLPRTYIAFYTVPAFFQFATDAILLWTLTRTVCQPLVYANRYPRAKGVGLGLGIPFGLVSAAAWALVCVETHYDLRWDWSEVVFFEGGGMQPSSGICDLILGGLGVLWGIVIFALAIRAVISTKSTLAAEYRAVPKLMIAASVVWILHIGLTMITELGVFSAYLGRNHAFSITPLIEAVFFDILVTVLLSILFLCYRPRMALLFAKNRGYARSIDGDYNHESQGASSNINTSARPDSVELQDLKD